MSKLIVITTEELESIFDTRLKVALERYPPPSKRSQPEDDTGEAGQVFVSKRAAAKILDCCTSSVDNAARAGKLRRHYFGKSVRFLRSEVLALAKANTNHKQTL